MAHSVSIAQVLEYRNASVIRRMMKEHNYSEEEAVAIFVEMLRFLAVCATSKKGGFSPSKSIDNAWHAFILHTADYMAFCHESFGRFIHHNPTDKPFTANRGEMLEMAAKLGADLKYWPKAGIVACDSSCTGDNYCTGDSVGQQDAECDEGPQCVMAFAPECDGHACGGHACTGDGACVSQPDAKRISTQTVAQ